MSKKGFFLAAFLFASSTGVAMAQLPTEPPAPPDTSKVLEPGPWNFIAALTLNLSQSAFSDNWDGGQRGSFVWVFGTDATAERQFSHKFNLSNTLQLAYGQTSLQVEDEENPDINHWEKPQKSTDIIMEESVGRFTLGAFVDPYVAFRLDSQFLDASSPLGDIPFSPLQLSETAGIAKVFEKTEKSEFISRLGLGFRQVFRQAFTGQGLEKESLNSNDGGIEWSTSVIKPLSRDRILYKGKLLVFAPLFYSESSSLEEFDRLALEFDPDREEVGGFWRVPDVNFQNTFTAQITKLLQVNLYLQLIYDKYDAATKVDTSLDPADMIEQVEAGIEEKMQYQESLTIGITYQVF